MRSILVGIFVGFAAITTGLAADDQPTTSTLPAGQSSVSTTTSTGLQQGNPSQHKRTTTRLQKQNNQTTTTGMQYQGEKNSESLRGRLGASGYSAKSCGMAGERLLERISLLERMIDTAGLSGVR